MCGLFLEMYIVSRNEWILALEPQTGWKHFVRWTKKLFVIFYMEFVDINMKHKYKTIKLHSSAFIPDIVYAIIRLVIISWYMSCRFLPSCCRSLLNSTLETLWTWCLNPASLTCVNRPFCLCHFSYKFKHMFKRVVGTKNMLLHHAAIITVNEVQ